MKCEHCGKQLTADELDDSLAHCAACAEAMEDYFDEVDDDEPRLRIYG